MLMNYWLQLHFLHKLLIKKKVNEVTPKLFSVAPNPEKMASLEEPEIKELIKEIGLSTNQSQKI